MHRAGLIWGQVGLEAMKIPACKSGTDKSAWAWCKSGFDVELEMTQPAKVQEPSMEEILASIRRIIADDEAKPAAAEKPPAAANRSRAAPKPRHEGHSAVGDPAAQAAAKAGAAQAGTTRRRRS